MLNIYMKNPTLLIHEKFILYEILNEIKEQFEFSIISFNDDDLKERNKINNSNYLFINKKKIKNINNQIILDNLPINILKLSEKINLNFLKLKFKTQSNIKVGKYLFNLNVREMVSLNLKLKLTEMEINTIIYLSKLKKPVKIEELRLNVWRYQAGLETHTVETHIYRLRKKILKKFNDNQFIISTPSGYKVN